MTPFNNSRLCYSYAGESSFNISFDSDGKNMLTNQNDGSFTISELEVWEVNSEK